MWSIPGKIVRGVQTHGLNYFVLRVRSELSYPRLPFARRIRSAVIAVADRLRTGDVGRRSTPKDCLQFVCDLAVVSIAFDFIHSLAAAELRRRQLGLPAMEVIFVPGPADGLRHETSQYDEAISVAARHWRLRHILLAALALLPSVRGYTFCGSREEAAALITRDPEHLYPEDYRVYLPRHPTRRVVHDLAAQGVPIFPMLRASERGRELIAQFLDRHAAGRRVIVITLRDYPYTPQRNSRVENWIQFASGLDPAIYAPIFVLDSETIMRRSKADFESHVVCEGASWDIELRMALYEAAWLNMAVMHGPMELCWFSESSRYLVFLEVGLTRVQAESELTDAGHPPGRDLIFAKPGQHIVWEGDHLRVIRREFEALLPLLTRPSADDQCGARTAASCC